jgi:hypothetical protein
LVAHKPVLSVLLLQPSLLLLFLAVLVVPVALLLILQAVQSLARVQFQQFPADLPLAGTETPESQSSNRFARAADQVADQITLAWPVPELLQRGVLAVVVVAQELRADPVAVAVTVTLRSLLSNFFLFWI